MKIDFKGGTNTYDPDFVEKILQGREDIANGKGIRIATEDIWKNISVSMHA